MAVQESEQQPQILHTIAEWSEQKIDDQTFLAALEPAEAEIGQHKAGLDEVVAGLTPEQQAACTELLDFAFQLLNLIEAELADIAEAVEQGDRNRVFIAGDQIARASFQLNETLIAFRHQALLSLGPTKIPNLNHLLSLKDDYLKNPGEEMKKLFQEGIDSERIVTYHAWQDLGEEPDLTEVHSLIEAFKRHMGHLNTLTEDLTEKGPQADFDAHFAALGVSFQEVANLVPVVQMKIGAQGETDIPDLNYLLNLMKEASVGNIGDEPLTDALESLEVQFSETKEKLEASIGQLDSALASDELASCVKTFEHLEEGFDAVYKFLEERDRLWLIEAKGFFLDFAKGFSGHQARLKEIEEQQNKILCPRCSTYNDQEQSLCSNCGSTLPRNVAAQETTTFQTQEGQDLYGDNKDELLVTANLEKLYEAVNQFHANEISDEQYLAAIARFEEQIDANAGAVPAEPKVDDREKAEAIGKIYDALEEGVDQMRQGLDLLKDYPSLGDDEYLKRAIETIDQGAKKVWAVGEATSKMGGS